MAAVNDITGDKLQSKSLSKQGLANWDLIDWSSGKKECCGKCSGDSVCKPEVQESPTLPTSKPTIKEVD